MSNKVKQHLDTFLKYCEKRKIIIRLFSLFLIGMGLFWYTVLPPSNFPTGRIITIESGSTLSEIAQLLHDKDIIHSKNLFVASVVLQQSGSGVLAGDYFFEHPFTTISIAKKMTKGEFGIDPIRITIYEGLRIDQVADIFSERFEEFDKKKFLALAEGKEGYLFPDTYLFLPNVKEDQVIQELGENFQRRILTVEEQISATGKTLDDIIIMASIIEKEAWKEKDQRLISGVLWKRLEMDMLLQVDATFEYINRKNTYELTYDDLKIDSPYNTYKYKGLPIGPIASPGLGAIKAALNPEISDYLFYLADREGNTYFSETYEEHKRYKALYID